MVQVCKKFHAEVCKYKKHSDNLTSKFDCKFYNVQSKTCCRKKQSCRKKPVQFFRLGPNEKDRIILKCLINERKLLITHWISEAVMPDDLQWIASISDTIRDSNSNDVYRIEKCFSTIAWESALISLTKSFNISIKNLRKMITLLPP